MIVFFPCRLSIASITAVSVSLSRAEVASSSTSISGSWYNALAMPIRCLCPPNGNYVDPFKPGSFKSAMKAKAPIVPVALIDSWKVFDLWSLRRVHTKVVYLEPLYYEEYKEMSSVEVCQLVYKRICKTIEEYLKK